MRLFLALELSETVRRGVAAVRDRLRISLPGWRWVRPENVHLTLRFLGDTAPDAVPRYAGAWEDLAAASPAIRFRIQGCGVFPGPRKPRILWAGVRDVIPEAALPALAAALERSARNLGYPAEPRAFRPHLTIARARRGGRPAVPDERAVDDLGLVEARDLVLFRSELHPSGARYEAMLRFPLRGRETGR